MTYPVRTRGPHGSRGTQRSRRTRSHGTALLLVAAGALLGWSLPRWERQLPAAGLGFDASTAQATLAAIAGGMITLAGFVVTAITLVVQTVQAMSPRLVAALGHFSRYLVLFGLLIGTALYALVTLSHVRGDHVPRISVTLAVGLVLIDAVTVLYLLASLRHAVTGGGLARAVGERLRTVIDQTSPAGTRPTGTRPSGEQAPAAQPSGGRPPGGPAGQGPGDGQRVAAQIVRDGRPAVLYAVDELRLTRLTARHDLRVQLRCAVGDFVGSGTPVASVTAGGTHPVPPRVVRRVAGCLRYGPSRTVEQDTAYGFRLLADIAARSLSAAVNDPTTAVQALDQIEDCLLRLSDRPLGRVWLLDPAGRPRVFCPAPCWPDLVSLALDETLLYGAADLQVVRRLRALCERLLAQVPEDRRESVVERRDALERLAAEALADPLLGRAAGSPDRQGLGGAYARGGGPED